MEEVFTWTFAPIALAIFVLPSIVSYWRKHKFFLMVTSINVLMPWTVNFDRWYFWWIWALLFGWAILGKATDRKN